MWEEQAKDKRTLSVQSSKQPPEGPFLWSMRLYHLIILSRRSLPSILELERFSAVFQSTLRTFGIALLAEIKDLSFYCNYTKADDVIQLQAPEQLLNGDDSFSHTLMSNITFIRNKIFWVCLRKNFKVSVDLCGFVSFHATLIHWSFLEFCRKTQQPFAHFGSPIQLAVSSSEKDYPF